MFILLPFFVSCQIVFTKVSTLPSIPRVTHSNFVIDSDYYIVGGFDSAGGIHSDIWRCSLNTFSWSQQLDCRYGKVYGSSGAAVGHYGIMANVSDSLQNPIKQTWKYNPYSDTWSTLAAPPVQTFLSASFAFHGNFFLCFGRDSFNNQLKTIWSYDTITNSWIQKASIPGSGRDYCSVAVSDSFAYFAGGRDSNYNSMSELWRYNIKQDSWLRLPDIPGQSRFGTMVYAFQNFLLVGFGAYTSPGVIFHAVSGIYKLDLSSLHWSSVTFSGLDTPIASEYTCFQYNKKCYFYGGYRSNLSYYNDLWMFDPAPLGPVWDTLSTGVQEVARDIQGLRVYPVPVRDILHIDGDIQGMDISVTDMMGRRCAAPVSGRDIAVSSLPAGVYVLHVSDRGAMVVRRFLKE